MSPSINQKKTQKLKIAIVAGEKSGDELGGPLIDSLKRILPEASFIGVGGTKMVEAGMESLFDIEKISVMGIVEPLLKIIELLYLRKTIKNFLAEQRPNIFIGIDAPDFNLPISRFLKQRKGIKTVQYVSPSVWAWRQGRTKKIGKSVDKILTLFPFEKEAYKDTKVDVSFVGHPLAHKFKDPINKKELKRKKLLSPKTMVIALLPGSRRSEVLRMNKILLETAEMIRATNKSAQFFMPFAESSHQSLINDFKNYDWVNFSVGDSQEVLAFSDIGIVTSGTATLEAALLMTPVVVAYKTSWLTYNLVKPLLKISNYSLPNLLAGKKILPELIQKEVTSSNLLRAFSQLEGKNYQDCLEAFNKIHYELRSSGPNTAAKIIAEML